LAGPPNVKVEGSCLGSSGVVAIVPKLKVVAGSVAVLGAPKENPEEIEDSAAGLGSSLTGPPNVKVVTGAEEGSVAVLEAPKENPEVTVDSAAGLGSSLIGPLNAKVETGVEGGSVAVLGAPKENPEATDASTAGLAPKVRPIGDGSVCFSCCGSSGFSMCVEKRSEVVLGVAVLGAPKAEVTEGVAVVLLPIAGVEPKEKVELNPCSSLGDESSLASLVGWGAPNPANEEVEVLLPKAKGLTVSVGAAPNVGALLVDVVSEVKNPLGLSVVAVI